MVTVKYDRILCLYSDFLIVHLKKVKIKSNMIIIIFIGRCNQLNIFWCRWRVIQWAWTGRHGTFGTNVTANKHDKRGNTV